MLSASLNKTFSFLPSYEPLRLVSSLDLENLVSRLTGSCCQVNEIHAFVYDLVHYNTDAFLTLHTDPIFVTKNHIPTEEFPPTVIHSLSRTLPSDN